MFLSRNQRAKYQPNPGTPQDFQSKVKNSVYYAELPDDAIADHLAHDLAQIPPTSYREGYHGDRHHDYWLSGVRDYRRVMSYWDKYGAGRAPRSFLDFGGSSGRVVRHMAAMNPQAQVYCADLGITAIEWALAHLPMNVQAMQSTILPGLPLADRSVDVITAFSVFTHVDNHEYGWLAELARVAAPGAMLYLTLMTEETWDACMRIDWRYKGLTGSVAGFDAYERGTPMPADKDKIAFYDKSNSYGTTFHSKRHVHKVWARFFDIHEIWTPPGVETIGEQTVVVCSPKASA